MSENTKILLAIAWISCAIVGAIIGAEKGKAGKGALLGFLFGPIGWVLMMLDIGVLAIIAGTALLALAVPGLIIAGVHASERDKDRMQTLKVQERAAQRQIEEVSNIPDRSEYFDVFNTNGTLKPLPQGTKVHNYWGYVRQHLSDGHLLVECGDSDAKVGTQDRVFQYCALLARGEGADLADGTQVRFTGIPLGVYQFEDVNHATRTIRRILYIPPEAMPEKEKSSLPPTTVYKSIFPAGVDTPEQRREYLKSLKRDGK